MDVGVPAFIDLLYGEFMSPAEQKMLTDGLDGVEAAAKAARGASFVSVPADGQDAILRGIAKAEEGTEQGFFRLIRSATVLGYFTSEQVGKNVLHYDPVPGPLRVAASRSSRSAGATGRPDAAGVRP